MQCSNLQLYFRFTKAFPKLIRIHLNSNIARAQKPMYSFYIRAALEIYCFMGFC